MTFLFYRNILVPCHQVFYNYYSNEDAYAHAREGNVSNYMGAIFEDICKQYLWKLLLNEKCTINFTELGRWWGANPKTRKQEEIDIVGVADKNTALFAECKWTNEKVDVSVLEKLIERSELFSHKNKHYYVFAKTGFTKACEELAKNLGNVTLIKYSDMV